MFALSSYIIRDFLSVKAFPQALCKVYNNKEAQGGRFMNTQLNMKYWSHTLSLLHCWNNCLGGALSPVTQSITEPLTYSKVVQYSKEVSFVREREKLIFKDLRTSQNAAFRNVHL